VSADLPRRDTRRYSSNNPRLILSASSIRRMVAESIMPRRFCNRARSMERIWFNTTADGMLNPVLPPPETSTSRGYGGLPNWELIAATMVTGLCSFEILF